jgi:hypothetical protein
MVLLAGAMARALQDLAMPRSKENFPFLWKQWTPTRKPSSWPGQGLTTVTRIMGLY